MSRQEDVAMIVRDPQWFAHRYDAPNDAVQFLKMSREDHRAAPFLRDEFIPSSKDPLPLGRAESMEALDGQAPMHFIFHSAYCCSTLLARAFDAPGHAMGLKEPLILNDMVGWNLRGADRRQLVAVLDNSLRLLSRPFGTGEAVVVKPSNIANGFIGAIMGLQPRAKALFLHAPLKTYLASIAKKGIEGRLWVRIILLNLVKENRIDLGFKQEQYLEHTDLQCAAIGWLAQHAEFHRYAQQFGPARIRTLDSEALLSDPLASMRALDGLFETGMNEAELKAVVAGPAFAENSKSGERYGARERDAEREAALITHAKELEWVEGWAHRVADANAIPMTLPNPLLR